MDELDQQLIALLRSDGRMSVATLARKLGVARGTVQNRMRNLVADGTILGFSVRLKSLAEKHVIRGLMTIATEGRPTDAIAKVLRGDPAIAALHTTNGRWDLVAEIRADTLQDIDQALLRIGRIDGVSHSETNLLLSTYKL
jgi:DNA-binding Lrp family transcriptional regulator